jgi:hypothetical protein
MPRGVSKTRKGTKKGGSNLPVEEILSTGNIFYYYCSTITFFNVFTISWDMGLAQKSLLFSHHHLLLLLLPLLLLLLLWLLLAVLPRQKKSGITLLSSRYLYFFFFFRICLILLSYSLVYFTYRQKIVDSSTLYLSLMKAQRQRGRE